MGHGCSDGCDDGETGVWKLDRGGGGMIRVLIWQYFAVILFTYFKMCYMYKGWVLNVWINMTMMRLGFGDWMASRGGGGGEGGG